MAQIYIGTSGWSYPKGEGTWKGHFYPKYKMNELEYYSQFFSTVEVNSSFYRPTNPGFAENWVKRTPKDFLFTVKLWQKFTHPKMYEEATGEHAAISQKDVDWFMSGIIPIYDSGKLGALLAQFPPSFKNDSYARQVLDAVIRTFGSYRLAVELRHKSWSDDENTARLLKEKNICWVEIDEPRFSSSIAAEVPVTSDISYLRFHGRNAEYWWKGDNETRYKYLYSPEEIQELAIKTSKSAEKVKVTFAFFNNHWQGYAPRNAKDIKKYLQLSSNELSLQGL
ncbi:DUF72 domain-containing protein [Chloroflexota bacterium]